MIWNRIRYLLSPQADIYEKLYPVVRGIVADIGFGTGFGTHLLSINAKEVCGYEVDERAIAFARRSFPIKNIRFEYGNIHKGIPDGPFNTITMIDVIEHLKDPKRALQNVKSMMGPGAQFILSTPNRLARYRKSEYHVREYAPKELESLLGTAFVNVSLRDYKLEPLASQYENPLLAVCRND
jgi:2-polyprenyl-3-methyl-5-hydroxy-6-metoxy-1,4-benzoquinol methylase